MSLQQFTQTVSIKIKPNFSKQLLIVLPHVFACASLSILLNLKGGTTIYFIISLFFIFLSLVYFGRLHLTLDSNKSIFEIRFLPKGSCDLFLKNDTREKVTILASSFSSNLLIILNFKDTTEKHYTALITSDSVSTDDFRRLKIFIKTTRLDA